MPPIIAAVGAGLASIGALAATAATAGAFLGISAVGWAAISVGISIGATLLAPKPKAPENSKENVERLRASVDPRTPRKTAVGTTALATDIRDEEFTDDQKFFRRFIVCASHVCESIDEIWFDDKIAWTLAAGVQGEFLNYLNVNVVPAGDLVFNTGPRMGDARKFTGLAYVYLQYQIGGNDKKVDSPFAQSVTTRITIKGKGARFYDPRLDSTVAGGSGSHRTADQATWEWDDAACNNPALALLFYLLGWRINGKLAVGKGIPESRIDLESFAIAANVCDETVGGEPRYRCAGIWSEGDSPNTVMDMLKATMNADLDDVDGRIRLTIFQDDELSAVADFDDADILGDFDWQAKPPLSDSFNIVRGVFTDPSNEALYQPADYPEVALASPDGIDRIHTLNLPMVESASQARRLAELRLQRQKYPGTFKAEFQATAWRCQKNSVIRLSFAPRGWTNKVFRVAEMEKRLDGTVPLVLREEDPAIYTEPPPALPIEAAPPTPYDPFKAPIIEQLLNINTEGLDAYLSPEVAFVPSDVGGNVTSYANAAGTFIIRTVEGVDISANFVLSTPAGGDPFSLTESYAGMAYSVAGGINVGVGSEDQVSLTIQATGGGDYDGVIIQRRFTIMKDYGGVTVPFVANANDQNALTPDTPGGLTSLSIGRTFDSGNVSIAGTFTFTHNVDPAHKNNIDGFEIMYWEADDVTPHILGTDEREYARYIITELSTSTHNIFFANDVSANKFYTVGVRAVRHVHTDTDPSGFVKSGIRQRGPYQPKLTQDFIGQIDGVDAQELSELTTNYNEDNDGNGLTPAAATGVTMSSTTYPDSTAAVRVTWNHSPSSDPANYNNIDGYLVGLRLDPTNVGYSYDPADNDFLDWFDARPDFDRHTWNGKPAPYWYTGVVLPYRRVRTEVDPDGIIFAPSAQSSPTLPHRPSATSNFTGHIDTETAANVRNWSGRASVGLNSDGTVSTGKVLTGSILEDAINAADWEPQGATIALGVADSFESPYLVAYSTGGQMRVQFILDFQMNAADPEETQEFIFLARTFVQKVGTLTKDYSSYFTIKEIWQPPSVTGTRYFPRRTIAVEYVWEGLEGTITTPVAYDIGYLLETDGNTACTCQSYRYIRASDERASE